MADTTEENLRDWVEKKPPVVMKKTMYKSKHSPDVSLVASSFNPQRVGDGYEYGKRIKMKPAIPTKEELGKIVKSNVRKNFVMANAVQAILDGEEPRQQTLPRRYTEKSDYGKIPKYLHRKKKELQAQKDAIAEAELQRQREEEAARGREFMLDDEERLGLVEELKAKWDNYNAQYQRQAHVVNLDTVGKIKRKEHLERMLKRVERAIETLERGPVQIFCKPGQ